MKRYSDKNGENLTTGILKDGVIEFWRKDEKKKHAITACVTIAEIQKALKCFNPQHGLYCLVKKKEFARVERWIESAPTEELRQRRRDSWEKDSDFGRYSARQDLAVDSAVKVVLKLYQFWEGKNETDTETDIPARRN